MEYMHKTALKVKNFFKNKNIHKYIFALIVLLPLLLYILTKENINTPTIYPTLFGESRFEAQNDIYQVKLGNKKSTEPIITLVKNDKSITFNYEKDLNPSVIKKGNYIYFENTNDNVDIRYTPLKNGIKEEIILKKKQDVNRFKFIFNSSDLDFAKNIDGTYSRKIVDKEGNYLFHIEPLFAYDSNNKKTDNVSISIKQENSEYIATIEVEKKWLTSKERVFPIYIDPTIIHDTSSEFSTGAIFNRVKDEGAGISPQYYSTWYGETNVVALWNMDELANDTCGSGADICDDSGTSFNNATVTGTTITTTGQLIGRAARVFNGSGDYATVPDISTLDPAEITIEAWIKPNAIQNGNIVEKGSNSGYRFRVDSAGTISFLDRGGTNILTSNSVLKTGNWYHIAVVGSTTGLYIYINGELDNQNSTAYGAPDTSSALSIGRDAVWGEYFSGTIDSIKIYNTDRTAAQIKASSQIGNTPRLASAFEESAVDQFTIGLWRFNETADNTCSGGVNDVCDISGNGLDMSNSGSTINITNPKLGAASRILNGSSYINRTVDDNILDPKEITIEAWIKPNVIQTGNFVNKGDNSGYRFRILSTGILQFLDRGATNYATGSSVLRSGDWYHVAAVGDEGGLKIYVNGVLDGYTNVAYGSPNSTGGLVFGFYTTGAEYFSGEIDEVRISNIARSPEEIKMNAKRRPYSIYTSDILDMSNVNNFSPLEWDELGVRTGAGETFFNTSNLIAQWKLNSNSGTTASNDSGSCSTACNGTLTSFSNTTGLDVLANSGWTSLQSKYDRALMFDGIDDRVSFGVNNITQKLNGASAITVGTWFKALSWPGASARERMINILISEGYTGISLNLFNINMIEAGGRSSTGDTFQTANFVVQDPNQWHYLVAVFDFPNDLIKLYLDGKLVNSYPVTFANATYTSGTPTTNIETLGSFLTTGEFFNGFLDNPFIYARELSYNEILSNYQAGNIELQTRVGGDVTADDGDWEDWKPTTSESTLYGFDDTLNDKLVFLLGDDITDYSDSNALVTNNGATGIANAGILLSALDFESTESDFIEVPDSPELSTGDNNFTITAWVKMESKTNHMMIVTKNDSSTNGEFRLLYNVTADSFRFVVVDSSGNNVGSVDSTFVMSPSINTWYFIEASYDTTNSTQSVCIKVNNMGSDCSSGLTGVASDTTSNFRIGAYFSTETYFFDGYIDEVGFWKRLLTSEESARLYNSGYPKTNGFDLNPKFTHKFSGISISEEDILSTDGVRSLKLTQGYPKPLSNYVLGEWNLDETGGTGAYIKDTSINGSHGTPTNYSSTIGLSGQSGYFNGSSSSISISNESLFDYERTQAFAIEAWIKTSSATEQKIFSKLDSNSPYSGYEFYVDNNGYLSFYLISNWGTGNVVNVHSTTTYLLDNRWHHVAVSYNGGSNAAGVSLYVDGVTQSKSVLADALTTTILNNISPRIGSRNGAAFYFNGKIDNVRFYKNAIGGINFREIYRLGRSTTYDIPLSSTDLSSKKYLAFDIASNRPGSNLELTIGESSYANYQIDTNTVGYWPLDETFDPITTGPRDFSRYQNNTVSYGTQIEEGYIGNARYFDGTDDFLDAGATTELNLSGNVTWEAWVKTTGTNNGIALTKGAEGDWLFALSLNSTIPFCKWYQANSGAGYLEITALTPVNDGQWHHVACVLSGTSLTVYVDGNNEGTDSTVTGTRDTSTTGSFSIGRFNWTSGYYYFRGSIDQVRVSNIARTQAEIEQTYQNKMRTYNAIVEFSAYLDSGNLISSTSDTSFTIDATKFGLPAKGDKLFPGDIIVIQENYNGVMYKAQGTVTSVNRSTGAVTVSAWNSGSTTPASGFTANANVFKWQTEYWDITGIYDDMINATTLLTLRLTNNSGGKEFYIDNMRSATDYLTDPTGSTITSSTDNRYLQYRIINTSTDSNVSSQLSSLTLDYQNNTPPNIPTYISPSNNITGLTLPVSLVTSSTDAESDYLRYMIIICENPEMDINCVTADQTDSQTGWSGQNAESNTAYTSGSSATYTTSNLNYGQTYFWKSYAIDPDGIGSWSSTQTTPYSFTLNTQTRSTNSTPIPIFSSTAQSEVTVSNSGWNNITGTNDSNTTASSNGWIDSTNFDLTKKYLIIATGSHNSDSLSGKTGLRILHGSTAFNESESIDITQNISASFKKPYFWFTIWTPVANEDIEVQLYWNGTGSTARAEDITLLAIDVTDQIDNGDLYFKEVSNLVDIPSVISTTASLSFTPQNSNEAWWILGYNQTDFTTGSGASFYNYLKVNDQEAVTGNSILVTSSEITPIIPLSTIQSLDNTNNEIEIKAISINTMQKSRHSAILALNINKLLDQTKTFSTNTTSIYGSDTWNQHLSLPVYNSVNNADWIVFGGGVMYANQEQIVGRLTLDSNAITDSVGGSQIEDGEFVPFVLSDYTQNLSIGLKTFKLEVKAYDTAGSPGVAGTWLIAFSKEISPTYTNMNLPTNQSTSQSLTPQLKMTAVDPDSDYIRYKVKVCTNEAMTQNCNTYDQTSSQTGWSGQDTQSNTAYTSGTQAIYTIQTPLDQNQTYYWIANSIDPAGTNTFHDDNPVPFSFTTTSAPTSPSQLLTEGSQNPTSVSDLTPEFSSIHNDPEGDSASSYQIQVNTADDFNGTSMWDSGKQSITVNNGARSSDISYAGTTLSYSGIKYYWRMKYWDGNDSEGSWSSTANFTMKSVDAPTKCRIIKANDNSQLAVYWTDISTVETGYRVEQKVDSGSWTILNDSLPPNANNISVGVSNNHTYQYRVAAKYNTDIGGYCTTDVASLYNGNFKLEGLKLEGVQIW